MFTGLIEATGSVRSLDRSSSSGRLTVNLPFPAGEVTVGASIAVNGACLTVTSLNAPGYTFDISPETLSRTTLGSLRPGSPVNLERALRFGDRLDGHIVTGHIDCIGEIENIREVSGNRLIEISVTEEHARQIVEKGSVAVDGISLTVNQVTGRTFSVNMIPLTLRETTLGKAARGMRVNIETDIIGKYVERLAMPWKTKGGLSLETLARNGFARKGT